MTIYSPKNEGRHLKVMDPRGFQIGVAAAACPEEGWLDVWIWAGDDDKGLRKVFVDRKLQETAKARVHTSYDLVDRRNGKVIHRVRWSMLKSSAPKLKHQDLR